MIYDYSDVSDEMLDNALANGWGLSREARVAVAKERARRDAARRESAVTSDVENNLAAAATPVTPDPVLKPRGWRDLTDEEIVESPPAGVMIAPGDMAEYDARYSEAHRNLVHSRADARRASGVPDPDQAAYNAATGLGASGVMEDPEYVMVDGVRVPTHKLSDGQSFGGMYTLRDLRLAKEAADEERLAAMFSKSAQEDLARYGTRQLVREARDGQGNVKIDPRTGFPVIERMPSTGPAPGMELSPAEEEQQDNLMARRDAEARTRGTWAYERARAIRMGEAAGISPSEALDILRSPGGQARLSMAGADKAAERRAMAKERFMRNARMVGGSQNLNQLTRSRIGTLDQLGDPAMNDWQRMILAETTLRNPQQMTPLGVQALGAQNTVAMLRGMNLGQGMDNPLVRAQAAAAEVQANQARQTMRQVDENVLGEKYALGDSNILPGWLGGGYDEFTIAEQQQMYDDLIARDYTPAEAQAAVDRQAVKRRATEKMQWTN